MPRFDFYLHDLSFQYQPGISLPELHDRIEHLATDCHLIRAAQEQIYRCNTIYEVPIFEEYTIMDVIWPNTNILDRDHRLYLQIIIDHSDESLYPPEEIVDLVRGHNDTAVSGLLCLYSVTESLPQEYLVYSENDWRKFHRHFLGLYPGGPEYFLSECDKCFPKLYFHERNLHALRTFKGGFNVFASQLVAALGALNDMLKDHLDFRDIPGSLKRFSSISGFETTNEGDLSRKQMLTFRFTGRSGRENDIYCEPHIKISKSSQSGDNTFYFYRIYFHFGKEDIADGRILIGHIGEHL